MNVHRRETSLVGASGNVASDNSNHLPVSMRGGKFVVFVSVIAALGGLLFGYDTGIISAALLFVGRDFGEPGAPVSDLTKELITAAIVAGTLAVRPHVVMIAACIFIAGSAAAAWAPSIVALVPARLLLGLAVGATTSPSTTQA